MTEQRIQVGCPNIGDRDVLMERIREILDRRWFTNGGPMVGEFEQRIADYLGVKHCVAVCNATIGLEIAARALGFSGEVIVPSFTFVATAHALSWQGMTPVFADVDARTHNLDPRSVESLISSRTRGIVGVHLWGRPCDTDGLERIAGRYEIPVLYDAAHAFGCSHQGRMIGAFGACEVFSFHATKFINSFEGGAIVTNEDALAAKLRSMRSFGSVTPTEAGSAGTNGKMSEVCAAMGLTSLEAIDSIVSWNQRNYELYRRLLEGVPGLVIAGYAPSERNNFQYVVIEIDPEVAAMDRDTLVRCLLRENIHTRSYFSPGCHRMEPYVSLQKDRPPVLPETERLCGRVMALPTGQAVDEASIHEVCSIIRSLFLAAAV